MARIKIEAVVEHLDHDLKRALAEAVERTIPGANFDRNALFKAFVKAVYRKCSTWESVPDQYVDTD